MQVTLSLSTDEIALTLAIIHDLQDTTEDIAERDLLEKLTAGLRNAEPEEASGG